MWRMSHAKFWPKKPVMKGQGQEDGGQDGELLDGGVLLDADLGLLDRDHRHVGLQHRAEQVPLGGGLLVDQQQVVVHIAQVGLQLGGFGGALDGGDHRQQRVDGAALGPAPRPRGAVALAVCHRRQRGS
jgi:hypothetical protein